MAVAAFVDEIWHSLVTRAAAKDVLLPELSKAVILEPFGKIVAIDTMESRFAVCAVDNDDVFWCEFV